MSTSEVDLCLSLSSWHEWMKLLEINKNCILSLITFSDNLLIVLNKTIG